MTCRIVLSIALSTNFSNIVSLSTKTILICLKRSANTLSKWIIFYVKYYIQWKINYAWCLKYLSPKCLNYYRFIFDEFEKENIMLHQFLLKNCANQTLYRPSLTTLVTLQKKCNQLKILNPLSQGFSTQIQYK